MKVTGQIYIAANDVTIEDTEVIGSGGVGSIGINIAGGVSGTVIRDSTVHGAGPTGSDALDIAVAGGATIERAYLYNCGECANGDPFTITDSYIEVTPGSIDGEHYEDIYLDAGGVLNASHDTLLNPQGQTAVVFAEGDSGCSNTLNVTNSLLAGGGYMIYGCSGAANPGSSEMDIQNNRFARCSGTPVFDPSTGGTDGVGCSSGTEGGYFPGGGYFGVEASTLCGGNRVWQGNVWDDDGSPVNCQ